MATHSNRISATPIAARSKGEEWIATDAGQSDPVGVSVFLRQHVTGLGDVMRVAFGLIWVIDAALKWLYPFQHGLAAMMSDGASGQPAWLMPWFQFCRMLWNTQPAAWALGIAAVETAIALSLVLGLARKLTYVAGAIWSLMIWSTAEGFGHPNPGMPWTDIGTSIMYAFIFLVLLALDAESGRVQTGTGRFSLDAVIERRLTRWRRVAEVRR